MTGGRWRGFAEERETGGEIRNGSMEDHGGGCTELGMAAEARGQRRRLKGGGSNNGILVAGARNGSGRGGGGGGMEVCGSDGGGGDGIRTPSLAFCQPLEMKESPFFSQMMDRVCGGGSLPLL